MSRNDIHLPLIMSTELSTRRFMLGCIGVPYLMIAIAFVGWGRPELSESLPAFRAALMAALGVLAVWEMTQQQKEQRLRLWLRLPFTHIQVGIFRLMPLQVMALFFLAVYGVARQLTGTVPGLSAEICSLLGITLLVNGLLQIYQDVMHGFHRQLLRLTGLVIFLAALLGANAGFVLMTIDAKQTLPLVARLERGLAALLVPTGYFSLLLVGLGVAVFSVYFFQKRKSYLG